MAEVIQPFMFEADLGSQEEEEEEQEVDASEW